MGKILSAIGIGVAVYLAVQLILPNINDRTCSLLANSSTNAAVKFLEQSLLICWNG